MRLLSAQPTRPSTVNRPASSNPWRVFPLWLLAVAGLLMSGCSSPPAVVRYHSLLASDTSMTVATDAAGAAPIGMVIAPVGIPPAIDQPQWLVRRADDTLQMLEQDRWAGPLGDQFRSALRARLKSRWGIVDASLPRQSDNDGTPSWRLVVEVLRMDARPANDALIDVRWTLLAPQRSQAAISCSAQIVEPVRGPGTVAIADAYRRAVARLADQVGNWLRSGAGSGAADCARLISPSA